MTLSISLTKRSRRRKQRDGNVVVQERHVLNYRDPRNGRRHQLFFDRKADAVARRDALVSDYNLGQSVAPERGTLTVAQAVERWLADRKGQVCAQTYGNYAAAARNIIGPVVAGRSKDRYAYAIAARKPVSVSFLPVLGHYRIQDLMTSDIRVWHKTIWNEVGPYSANRAKMFLCAAMAMAAEDFNLRPPPMPINLGRGRRRTKKAILAPEQVGRVLESARCDIERGIYVAFPFLVGTRPSEQLGLLWKDVDFDKNLIRICRTQSENGELTELTKTEAGTREIPMCDLLRQWLLEWRLRCPRVAGELYRVFPGLGNRQAWPKPRIGGGGPLSRQNFRKRIWSPGLKQAGVPYVTPHSARHSFISILQRQGVEVGLVAKLAGHANPNVTLGHYTQAVRGGADAVRELERALRPAS